jgi:hypothetical protein
LSPTILSANSILTKNGRAIVPGRILRFSQCRLQLVVSSWLQFVAILLGANSRQRSEKAVRFVVDSSRKEERIIDKMWIEILIL